MSNATRRCSRVRRAAFTQIVKDCRFLAGSIGGRLNILPCAVARSARTSRIIPLELGEDTHHLEQRLARRGRGVHALLVKVQVDPEGVKLREECH
jgi:hypothetical protein